MRVLMTFFILTFTQVSYAVAEKKVIPSLTTEPVGIGSYVQMFFGLFIVVALIFGMAWFMRRIGNINNTASGNLKVLGGVSVGQRERIVLVQAGETQLLVGVAPGAIRTLHIMDKPIVTPATSNHTNSKNTGGFAEKLHDAIKNRGRA